MNGSRSDTPRNGDRNSLDALNRTIEGLEARIEGLIGQARERKPDRADSRDAVYDRSANRASDPLTEIVERQRRLVQPRERLAATTERTYAPAAHAAPAPRREPELGTALADITAALDALRHELKHDLADSLGHDIAALRADVTELREQAGHPDQTWIRTEFDRLGGLMDRLAREARPSDLSPLRAEFEDLRGLIGRSASQDSVSRLESRIDQGGGNDAMREEIVALAWRLDEMKANLGSLDASPAIRRLEDKLIAMAKLVEAVGQVRHDDSRIVAQFATLDNRLDEISRAIAASSRSRGEPDRETLTRLDERLAEMAEHLDRIGAPPNDMVLLDRLQELSDRVGDLAEKQTTERLEQRLLQLSAAIDSHQGQQADPEVTFYLADLSRKIDGLDQSGATAGMIERLDRLAARLDNLDAPSSAPTIVSAPSDQAAFGRLESRLADIARRLDDTVATPSAPNQDLSRLEQQIAHLSSLFATSGAPQSMMSSDVEDRMASLEQTMAANDEYILEAARQAAEAVVDAFARQGGQSGAPAGDIAALSALAEDLRALEDFTRSSDERNWRTFEALHETLVNISDRLNELDSARHIQAAPAAQTSRAAEPVRTEARPAEIVRDEMPVAARMPRADMAGLDAVSGMAEPLAEPVRLVRSATTVPVFEEDLPQDMFEAAAEATAQDVMPENRQAAEEPAPSKSLFVNLGRKLLGSRAKKAEPQRTVIEPTPALDSTDMLPAERANDLIEPGADTPELRKILDRVRASKVGNDGRGRASPARSTDRSDVIAAARRAAEAAAAEVAANEALAPKKAAKPAKGDKAAKAEKPAKDGASGSLVSKLQENRRPVLLAAGAILLVIMSYPLVSSLMDGRVTPDAAVMATDADNQTQPVVAEAAKPDDSQAATSQADMAANTDVAAPVNADVSAEQASVPDQATDVMMDPAPSTNAQSTLVPPAGDDVAATPESAAKPASETAAVDAKAATPEAAATEPAAIELPAGLASPELADAVKKNDPLALFEIGARYTDGRGTAVDLPKAAEFYGKSAELGFAPALYRLANFYEKGTGVDRDIAKAKALYAQAAEKGNASAMHNLAVLSAAPSDTAPDYASAVKWFEAAANLGIGDSQFNLAILYARGNGVSQDLVESYKWFAIAAKGGDKDAAQKRDEVANVLKKDQLENAKAKAELWKPAPLDPAANSITVPDAWIGKPDTTASVDVKKAIRNIQAILNNNGFDSGKPDGEMGAKTVSAIKAFQKSIGLEPTGRIDDALVKALLERNKKG